MFKVGDKVRCIQANTAELTLGMSYLVMGLNEGDVYVEGCEWSYSANRFVLVEEFKLKPIDNPLIEHIPAKVSIKPTTFQLGSIKFRTARIDKGDEGVYIFNERINSNNGRYTIADLKSFAKDINLLIEALEEMK